VRILIAEDEALMRDGLALVLAHGGFTVVGEAADADQLLRMAARLRPDVVVTDVRMPPTRTDDGLRAAITIRSSWPETAVVVLSQYVPRRNVMDLVGDRAECVGYLLKHRVTNTDQFCRHVRRVGSGGTVLDPEVAALLVARARRDRSEVVGRLTPRQLQVLSLIAEGRTNSAIAQHLHLSEKTVVQHTSHIYDQLDLAPSDTEHRRVLAVLRYLAR
jgi:DNA-binding NarL/FixJ family response regulator